MLAVTPAARAAPVSNPTLPGGRCGLRVALVVDTSSSIVEAGADNPDLMRAGGVTLLQALEGTASTATVVSFRNNAVTELPPTGLDDAAGFRRAVQAVRAIRFDVGAGPGSGTNWESALRAARTRSAPATSGPATELVLFLTDGNPNRYGQAGDRQPASGSNDFDPLALAAGVAEADQLRRAGTRVVAVGVGDVREDSLTAVSGPARGADWFVGDFEAVADSVAAVATDVCGTRLRARSSVDGIPASNWPFRLAVGRVEEERSTGDDGGALFVLPRSDRPRPARLGSRAELGAAELASVVCTVNDRPLATTVDLGRATASFPLPPRGVVACEFAYERNPASTSPDPGVPGRESRPGCEAYRDTGAALTPLSTIRLYVQLRRTICDEAGRFAIDELLLAVTIQHEGYDRSKLVQGRIDKWIENQFTLPVPFVGRNDTVGVGQMRPDLARRLARTHFDIYDDLSEDAVRRKLVYDNRFAVRMAAAYLRELQADFDLTDRQTFIAYAFGATNMVLLVETRFDGREARPRGEKYDRLARQIIREGEGFA